MAEVGLGRRETASKVGSRPLDSPTSSPGPLNFEEVSRCTRERERDSSPLTTDDNAFDIGNIISVELRREGLFACEFGLFRGDGTEFSQVRSLVVGNNSCSRRRDAGFSFLREDTLV